MFIHFQTKFMVKELIDSFLILNLSATLSEAWALTNKL